MGGGRDWKLWNETWQTPETLGGAESGIGQIKEARIHSDNSDRACAALYIQILKQTVPQKTFANFVSHLARVGLGGRESAFQ